MDGTQVEAYDVCLGGRLGAEAQFTRPIFRKVPADKVKYALENLFKAYQTEKVADDTFGHFVDRNTNDDLADRMGLHLLAQDDPTWVPPARKAAVAAD